MKTFKLTLVLAFAFISSICFGQHLDVEGNAKITGSLAVINPSALITMSADSTSKSVISYFNGQLTGPLVFSEAEFGYYLPENTFGFTSGGFAGLNDAAVSIDISRDNMTGHVNGIFNVGPLNNKHVTFDGLGIQAKGSSETVEEDLYLNHYGKDVLIGGIRAGTKVGIGETFPQVDLHIKQVGNLNGTRGLRLEMHDTTAHWDVYIDEFRDFNFRYNNNLKSWVADHDGSYNQSSDRRLKTNISYYDNVLDKVIQLRPASYRYWSHTENTAGLIAQEVEALFPEFVSEKEGFKGVNYAGLSVMSFKAIQEQQEIINKQSIEIDDLKARLTTLESLIKNK